MIAHYHGHLNGTKTETTLIVFHSLVWKEERKPQAASTLDKELQATKERLKWEKPAYPGKSSRMVSPGQVPNPENIYIKGIIY